MGWNGKDIRDQYAKALGDKTATFKSLVTDWINEIIEDICSSHPWAFLKEKGKTVLEPGKEEHKLGVAKPFIPSVVIASGGSLTEDSTYRLKIVYVEENGIRSQASVQSSLLTATAANKTITVAGISTSLNPLVAKREIYLSKDSERFYFHSIIEDNTTKTASITTETTSTLEAPDYSPVKRLVGNPWIESANSYLKERSLDQLRLLYPGVWTDSLGTPRAFGFSGDNSCFLYPPPTELGTKALSYATASDVTLSDSDELEVSGGVTRLKDMRTEDSILAATYTTLVNLNWRTDAGSLTGTLNGAPSISGNKLVCTGAQGVSYSRTTAAIESFKVKFTPNYSTNHPANINFLGSYNGTNNNDTVLLLGAGSGSLFKILLYDSSGVILENITSIGGSLTGITSGTEIEILLVVNSTAGTIRVFFDGVLHGTISRAAWTRGGITSKDHIGANTRIYDRAEGSFADFILFDNEQKTATYTPGYTVAECIYATGSPNALHNTAVTMDFLRSLAKTTVSEPTNTELKFSLNVDGSEFYHDGQAWVASSGAVAQSNTLTEITNNVAEAIQTLGASFKLRTYFTSDGVTLVSVTTLTITYSLNSLILSFNYEKIIPIISESQDSIPVIPPWMRPILRAGVIWLGFQYRERAGQEGKKIRYEEEKKSAIRSMGRLRTGKRTIRDVVGDTEGREV